MGISSEETKEGKKMKEPKVGTSVQMNRRLAKWYVNNPDTFYPPDGVLSKESRTRMNSAMQLSLMCLMGIPIPGVVLGRGTNVDGVHHMLIYFEQAGLRYSAYYNPFTDLKVMEKK